MRDLGLFFLPINTVSVMGPSGDKCIVILFKISSENIHLLVNLKDQRASKNQQEKVLHSTKPSDKIT